MNTHETDRLEVGENASFERKAHIFHRVGLMGLTLFVVLGLLGVFGGGGLSAVRKDDGPLRVSTDQFLRYSTTAEMRIHLDLPTGVEPEIRLNRDFADAVEMEQILPPPLAVIDHGSFFVYRFPPTERGKLIAIFSFKPGKIGPMPLRVQAAGTEVAFSQFVYP